MLRRHGEPSGVTGVCIGPLLVSPWAVHHHLMVRKRTCSEQKRASMRTLAPQKPPVAPPMTPRSAPDAWGRGRATVVVPPPRSGPPRRTWDEQRLSRHPLIVGRESVDTRNEVEELFYLRKRNGNGGWVG